MQPSWNRSGERFPFWRGRPHKYDARRLSGCALRDDAQSSLSVGAAAAPPEAFATFHHDPRVLLPALEEDRLPPMDLPAGEYRVRLSLKGDTLEVDLVD